MRFRFSVARMAAFAAIVGFVTLLPVETNAQNNAVVTKLEASLAPPVGATDTAPKGKATVFYKTKGEVITQRLSITLQHLEKRTDYSVVVDGFFLGEFSPKGNSGSLILRFRDPAKGHQTPLPIELAPLVDAQIVQVFKVETGELILEGTFELLNGE